MNHRQLRWFMIWAAAWVLLIILSCNYVDYSLSNILRNDWPRSYRKIGNVLSELGLTEYYLVPIAFAAIFCWFKGRVNALRWWLLAFAQIGGASLCSTILKFSFGRFRPNAIFRTGQWGWSFFSLDYSSSGFPSGHTTTAAAVAAVLCLRFPRWRVVWIFLPILVGVGRVISISHFLSDVLAAILVAVLFVVGLEYFVVQRKQWFVKTPPPETPPEASPQASLVPKNITGNPPADASHSPTQQA